MTVSFIRYNRNHYKSVTVEAVVVKDAIKKGCVTYKNIITAIWEIQGWLLGKLMTNKHYVCAIVLTFKCFDLDK